MLLTSRPVSLIGARHPRVEVRPEYDYTFGPEACDLMARAGKPLDPWQCDGMDLMLGVRDELWACFEYAEIVARQNGKGGLLEARALAAMFLLGEELIMWSAHEYKTAMEAFRRILSLLRRLGTQLSETLFEVDGVPVKVNNTNGDEGLERLDTEQRLKFIARSKGSGRGFSGDVNIIDETFAYTLEQQAALMPTMNARDNPQIIYTSSPPLDSLTGLPMHELRKRAEAILTGEVPADVDELTADDSFGYRDWGAAGSLDELDKVDLEDRRLWAGTNPALGIRITPRTIARNRRMGPRFFAREVLGIWPPAPVEGGGVIDPKQWAAMGDLDSERVGDLAVAVDLAPDHSAAAIAVYGVRADELGHARLVDHRSGTAWVVPRLVELRTALSPIAVAMGRGTFAALETELAKAGFARPEDPDEPKRGDLAVVAGVDMAAATGQFLDAVRVAAFRYVPELALDTAVAGAKTRNVGDAIAWARAKVDVDIAPLVALTVARWAYLSRLHLVTAEYDPLANFW